MIYLGNKTVHHHDGYDSPSIGGNYYKFRINDKMEGSKMVKKVNIGDSEVMEFDNSIVRVTRKSIARTIERRYWHLEDGENIGNLVDLEMAGSLLLNDENWSRFSTPKKVSLPQN